MMDFDISLSDDGCITLSGCDGLDEVPFDFHLDESKQLTLSAALDAAKIIRAGGLNVAEGDDSLFVAWADLEIFATFEGVTLLQEFENRCDSSVFITRDQLAEVIGHLVRLMRLVKSMEPDEPEVES